MPKKIDQPKETIIKIAKEILENEGYSELSIRNLAKRSGVSIGTIYNYFQDKKVLDMVLMTEFWTEYEYKVEKICRSNEHNFYDKIREIDLEMRSFIEQFKELFAQVFESRNYTYSQEEKGVKMQMLGRMANSLEQAILLENPTLSDASPNAKEIADWILNSLMMVSHLKTMSYDSLEKFIVKMMV